MVENYAAGAVRIGAPATILVIRVELRAHNLHRVNVQELGVFGRRLKVTANLAL